MEFSTIFYPNPRSDNGEGKYYPRPVYVRTIGMEELVADITHATSLTAADVTAADITPSSIRVTMLVDYGLRQYVRGNTTFSKVRARKAKDADAATDSDTVSAEESDSEKTE